MSKSWNLHYEGWMIGDGEPHQQIGNTLEWFVVEFKCDTPLKLIEAKSCLAIPMVHFEYNIAAKVMYLSHEGCVIDFGLTVAGARDSLAANVREGDFVAGKIRLELPADTHILADEVLKSLGHKWHINKIYADVDPRSLIPGAPWDGYYHGDFKEVESTWQVASHYYVFECEERNA